MQIDLIPEWQLSPADDRRIASLLRRCFDTDFGDRSFFMQRPHVRLVLRDGDQIVTHMAIALRAVRIGGVMADIAGLCDVATAPERRGNGFAATLLQAAIAHTGLSPARYVLLFGHAKLYGAAGFQKMGNLLTFVDMQGARTGAVRHEPAQELMVLSLKGDIWDKAAPLDLLGPLF